nr:INO80 complex subunit D-like [Ipomoea batatas]
MSETTSAAPSYVTVAAPHSSNPYDDFSPTIELKIPINYSRASNPHISSLDFNMPEPISIPNNSLARNAISSSTSPPILIDGREEDVVLARSKVLHRMEVLRRRSRRIKQLSQIYRDYYWALMEEVKLKYRDYYWEYGKSPFEEDSEENNISNANHVDSALGTGENPNCNTLISNNGSNKCGVCNCKSKAMALTRFCHMHILSDPRQKLYKPCSYSIKSSPTGPILCGKPVLRSMVPCLCSPHLEKADKYATRALKKAGLNISSTSKLAPKFHVIVAEYVNQIQNRRRALKAASENSETKEDNCA